MTIEDDGAHCNIVKEQAPNSAPERIHMKLLVVIDKNRYTVPIYPAEDLVQKQPEISAQMPIIEEKRKSNHPIILALKN